MKNTFKVIFYLKKRSLREGEKALTVEFPIMGRITIKGMQAVISCKRSINPTLWDASANRAKGKSEQAKEINRILNVINAKITRIYHDLFAVEKVVTAQKVKTVFEGFSKDQKTLIQSYEDYIEDFAKRIGKDRKPSTLRNIKNYFRILKSYMRDKLGIEDITFHDLTPEFMKGFIAYMRYDMKYSSSYMADAVRKCRRIAHKARKDGIIYKDPFRGYWVDHTHKERTPLEELDIQKFMSVELKDMRMQIQRDIFLFMVFTGISFCDLQKLEYDRIKSTKEGEMWIMDKRLKNDAAFKVKLMPQAKELVEKYRNHPKKTNPNQVLPVKSYIDIVIVVRDRLIETVLPDILECEYVPVAVGYSQIMPGVVIGQCPEIFLQCPHVVFLHLGTGSKGNKCGCCNKEFVHVVKIKKFWMPPHAALSGQMYNRFLPKSTVLSRPRFEIQKVFQLFSEIMSLTISDVCFRDQ